MDQNKIIIEASIDQEKQILTFVTKDNKTRRVSLSIFKPSGTFPNLLFPNFSRVKIIDWGHTLKFGKYEASTSSIISECKNPSFWLDG